MGTPSCRATREYSAVPVGSTTDFAGPGGPLPGRTGRVSLAAIGGSAQPLEAPLPELDYAALQLAARDVQAAAVERLSVHLHAAAGEQPARLRAADPEGGGERLGQVDRVALGERRRLHLLRRLVSLVDAVEVLLGAAPGLLA